jgi:gamma-glutamyltranspeptidase/glutathione hydrolase
MDFPPRCRLICAVWACRESALAGRLKKILAGACALFCLRAGGAPPALAADPAPNSAPNPVYGLAPGTPAQGHALVAAANPYAAQAGMEVLRRGGTAVDAAVAIQAALGLVEPQSSGVGGGAFLLVYDAKTRKVIAFNGRETAPMAAGPNLWLDAEGKPLPFRQAVVSGRATGVPGAIAALSLAQHKFGRLAWRELFEGPIELADKGFTVSPRLADYLKNGGFPQIDTPDVHAYFKRPDGQWLQAGDTLRNPAYAETLRRIATQGAHALYGGSLAKGILDKTHQTPLPGALTLKDFQAYRAIESWPLCRPYRAYIVCVPPPPSSGVGLLEQLDMLEHTDIAARGPADPRAWEEIAESSRLMYADRDKYVGDPKFVSVPVEGLLDPGYVAARAALIGPAAGPTPAAGDPPGAQARGKDHTLEPGGTTHFVVVDRWGNAVSMTTTVESIFGTGRMTHGFFLNNQLTDFSFMPTTPDGAPAANAPGPGKRPRSTMSPVIVLDREGRLVAAVGSPGGNQILEYDVKALVGMLDWNLPVKQAISLPNLIARGDTVMGETDKFPPQTLEGLRALGEKVQGGGGAEGSGLHGVHIIDGKFDAGADPRREGVVLTD